MLLNFSLLFNSSKSLTGWKSKIHFLYQYNIMIILFFFLVYLIDNLFDWISQVLLHGCCSLTPVIIFTQYKMYRISFEIIIYYIIFLKNAVNCKREYIYFIICYKRLIKMKENSNFSKKKERKKYIILYAMKRIL